mmetsp:Transcript_27008/g.67283  ORF Transcript_27008/g.67283 Transcript_27008/m.67283 type:complete len:300 (-) Transcript_27008:1348-2247(-)
MMIEWASTFAIRQCRPTRTSTAITTKACVCTPPRSSRLVRSCCRLHTPGHTQRSRYTEAGTMRSAGQRRPWRVRARADTTDTAGGGASMPIKLALLLMLQWALLSVLLLVCLFHCRCAKARPLLWESCTGHLTDWCGAAQVSHPVCPCHSVPLPIAQGPTCCLLASHGREERAFGGPHRARKVPGWPPRLLRDTWMTSCKPLAGHITALLQCLTRAAWWPRHLLTPQTRHTDSGACQRPHGASASLRLWRGSLPLRMVEPIWEHSSAERTCPTTCSGRDSRGDSILTPGRSTSSKSPHG